MIPVLNCQFAQAPGLLDPRFTFVRTSTAMVTGPTGLLQAVAANVPRFEYDPVSLRCRGLLIEQQRTNYFIRAQEFDNAAWTKSNITVTANSTAAPDGTATADTLAATGITGACAQGVTITAGRGCVVSFYLKPNASTFAFLVVGDGTNTVIQWFNLAAKTKGSQVGGAGTLQFSQAFCEDVGRGWVRCSVEVTTATVTAITAYVAPCASDGADTANGNSCYAWGAQFEAEQTGTSVSSYIPTTSATVTRTADNLTMPTSALAFNDQAGTLFFSVWQRPVPLSYTGLAYPMYGGFGDSGAFNDKIYVYRQSTGQIGGVVGSSSGGPNPSSNPAKSSLSFVAGARRRIALAWALNDLALQIDNNVMVTDAGQDLPVAANLVRLAIGGAPWGAVSQYTCGQVIYEAVQYLPARAANADLIAMCAA